MISTVIYLAKRNDELEQTLLDNGLLSPSKDACLVFQRITNE